MHDGIGHMVHPPWQAPPGRHTPSGQTPPIWSMSGRYASYWNAFLFCFVSQSGCSPKPRYFVRTPSHYVSLDTFSTSYCNLFQIPSVCIYVLERLKREKMMGIFRRKPKHYTSFFRSKAYLHRAVKYDVI